MLYLIITIFTIGLILIPFGTLYTVYEARKPGSKYANKDVCQRFRAKMVLLSIAVCGISILLLDLFRDHL